MLLPIHGQMSGIQNCTKPLMRLLVFANYDIGHNFNTTGGGNAGCLACVCLSTSQTGTHKEEAIQAVQTNWRCI